MDVGERVRHWLDAADRARGQARQASAKAAVITSPVVAARFEREAELHLRSAACFEDAARAAYETSELELEITRNVISGLQ